MKRDADKASAAAANVRKATDNYLRAARSDDNDERKLKSLLWAADTCISGPSLDAAAAKSYLDRAAPLAAALPQGSSAVAEYHYRLLQLAQKQKDGAAAQEHSDWLANNAQGSSFELAGVINQARDADAAVASASPSQRPARVAAAVEVYQRLVEIVGQSSEKIAAEKNARVANSKLAGYEYDLGRYAQAAQRLERLLVAFPDDPAYLRRGGLAQYKSGDVASAIEHWRKLTRGLKTNSPEWYEAKYYQLACLQRIDKSGAVAAYRQFRLLHPKVDAEPWRSDPAGLQKGAQVTHAQRRPPTPTAARTQKSQRRRSRAISRGAPRPFLRLLPQRRRRHKPQRNRPPHRKAGLRLRRQPRRHNRPNRSRSESPKRERPPRKRRRRPR